MLIKILEMLMDILFPPTETEKLLREIKSETIYEKCQKERGDVGYNIFSIFKYKDPFVEDSIVEIKKNKNQNAIDIFAELLSVEIIFYLEDHLINTDYKIPITFVPQDRNTFMEKGFNQGEELARTIVRANNKIFELKTLLLKTRKTKPQHQTKNRKQRLKNIIGAFEINPIEKKYLKGKIIIIVDDVVTTGATLNEARRQLLAAGASSVICFTIAH